jgi:hypothetical protein
MRRALLVGLAAAVLGCGDDLLGVGQTCTSSGECADGLLCDFGHHPPVCAPSGTLRDLAVPRPRDGSVDLNAVD